MENKEFSERLLTLPPNLRLVVCAGIDVSLAEQFYQESKRDLSDKEAWAIRSVLENRVAFSMPVMPGELSPKFPEIQVAPKRNGIPWNKKQQFNRPIR